MNREELKAKVRDLLKQIYFNIDRAVEEGKCDHVDDDQWICLMISAQALRIKEAL